MLVHQIFSVAVTDDKIASQDVENAFYADKRVAEAAAIGVPDERLGELVGVIVSLHPSSSGVKESDLLESVRPRCVQLLGMETVVADTLDLRDMLYPLLS
jgi:acyl-CoA synthetase (AMP-forming)/AMP-acid ligase II